VQSPFDDVTMRPSEVDNDMLLDPLPLPEVEDDTPPPVVKPDTLPPAAVTELVMPPVFGGDSPGFR
jgi:hypothetical protein